MMTTAFIPVGISARHVHVTKEDLAALFGEGYELTVKKDLTQPGQFASNEQVDLVTAKGSLNKVRILGPIRAKTQIELALTDAMKLGLKPPVRDSGDVAGSPGIKLVGPKGTVDVKEGVIVAKRHIHMTPADAAAYGVKDKDIVQVKFDTERSLIFGDVLIRVRDDFALDMHIDTDEANACLCKGDTKAELIK